jgi:hypothetical protein
MAERIPFIAGNWKMNTGEHIVESDEPFIFIYAHDLLQ